jgi:hypothetical protein
MDLPGLLQGQLYLIHVHIYRHIAHHLPLCPVSYIKYTKKHFREI